MIRLDVSTPSRTVLVDITRQVQQAVQDAGIENGVCYLYVPHTTAGITINENADPSVKMDILEKLSEWVPQGGRYHHREGNADAHIKTSLVGSSEMVFVEGGKLLLGTWQGIFLCEFDGPRHRRVLLEVKSS
ncbi:MAG: secondary thiamine-phosphate synthase enzyme YjbQ [Anaerolineae bacterium]